MAGSRKGERLKQKYGHFDYGKGWSKERYEAYKERKLKELPNNVRDEFISLQYKQTGMYFENHYWLRFKIRQAELLAEGKSMRSPEMMELFKAETAKNMRMTPEYREIIRDAKKLGLSRERAGQLTRYDDEVTAMAIIKNVPEGTFETAIEYFKSVIRKERTTIREENGNKIPIRPSKQEMRKGIRDFFASVDRAVKWNKRAGDIGYNEWDREDESGRKHGNDIKATATISRKIGDIQGGLDPIDRKIKELLEESGGYYDKRKYAGAYILEPISVLDHKKGSGYEEMLYKEYKKYIEETRWEITFSKYLFLRANGLLDKTKEDYEGDNPIDAEDVKPFVKYQVILGGSGLIADQELYVKYYADGTYDFA